MFRLTIILMFLSIPAVFGQTKTCVCEGDTLMNSYTISCDTTILSNNSLLYWNFTCDRIWLTLENKNGKKIILNEVPSRFYPYTYRLGYHLVKEFGRSLLFRSDCQSNGPCRYSLIDKVTGRKVKEFPQLIGINDESEQSDTNEHYRFDFVVYLSPDSKHILLYFIDTGRKMTIPFKEQVAGCEFGLDPAYQFGPIIRNGTKISLSYTNADNQKKTIVIDGKK